MAHDVISLLLFIGVILLAFFRKVNVGVVALAVGAIAVRIFGLTDKQLIAGISASMFATLVGITLLFAAVTQTGALDLLARKIIALAGNRMWIIPIAVYIAGFIVAGVGPGAIPALAIIPAIAAVIAVEVGFDPIMLVLIGEAGLMAGRMTPITPEAAIITKAAADAGIDNVMGTVLLCQTLVTMIYSVIMWVIFKGYKVKTPLNPIEKNSLPKFNSKQIIALCGVLLMMILLIFCNVNIGIAAFGVAALLFLLGVADDAKAIKALPWGTIVMVLSVGALLDIVNAMGGIDLMSQGMSAIMTKSTATPIMGISAGLLNLVSSALGVVYPTMMPMCAGIAEQVGGVNPVALMAAVGAGGSLAGISPLSTGGALAMAAMGTAIPNLSKEEENRRFIQLFIMAGIALLTLAICCAVFYNLVAALLHG